MEEAISEAGDMSTGYMLVPWANWDQWNFVRDSLFSPNPAAVAAALRRVAAWRGRGCLPVAVQVTASFVEIRRKDPFFSEGLLGEAINSEDMLATLYSMAITRYVNGFVEKVNGFDNHMVKHAPEKKKHSIFQLANAIGMPRMLVDIRHECSHCDIPSLPLLRLASTKALNWLKSHYWEPQKRMIPDIKKDIRLRLHQVMYYVNSNQGGKSVSPKTKGRDKKRAILHACNKLSSPLTGKILSPKSDGSQKKLAKTYKLIASMYSLYPMEVVSSLLEIFKSHGPFSSSIKIHRADDSSPGNSEPLEASIDDFKAVIIKLASKTPGLLLTMLQEIIGMIERKEDSYDSGVCFLPSSEDQAHNFQIEHLSSLASWLTKQLKVVKNSNQIGENSELHNLSLSANPSSNDSYMVLLRKCLLLSVFGNKHLSDSAMSLADMIGQKSLSEKLKKLASPIFLGLAATQNMTTQHTKTNIFKEWDHFNKALDDFEVLRSSLVKLPNTGDEKTTTKRRWNLAKSWSTCPIGMLPSPYNSTAFFPILDKDQDVSENKRTILHETEIKNGTLTGKREACSDILDGTSLPKKLKKTMECDNIYSGDARRGSLMEGRLLIGGVWRSVGEEEIQAIQSAIRILVK